MIVSILLDKPVPHYTNLDVLTGRIQLRVTSNTNVSSIVVKLEGESRTRLVAPARPDRQNRPRPVLEVHKILYKVQVVFPPPQLQTAGWETKNYTLNTGQYEYPFTFKLPFNNSCSPHNSLATNLNIAGLQMEIGRTPTRHVKQTLPPSLSGFPGEAEIRYYVKCTVNRPSLLKENPRAFAHFNFLPIEPPRPAAMDGEAYARRQHQFNPATANLDGTADNPAKAQPPRFSVDARLPNPAILTCNDDVPLRIIVKQLNERTEPVYLQMLQIELLGYTHVRAHEVARLETNSWVLVSMSNMGIPLGSPSDVAGTETELSREYWYGRALPNTVAPTFETCNISRYYELEVRVGLGYASKQSGRDQLIVLPLRLPVKVFSGVKPSPELLQAMSNKLQRKPVPSSAGNKVGLNIVPPVNGAATAGPSNIPPTPTDGAPFEDAPPSYEDVVAQDLPPVDGPRRDYAPPPVAEGAPRFSGEDQKRTG
ncbi:arrestin [Saccharata proteae CBS 121410]|uniref:Arrestin n=1 Tax=Saccharata proteae CBS 121410 TaxID=1314787 RepID=A0A9P4I116_9PEZI|nr:arrestin [Saccharata proteae CBS 121410]